MSAVAAALLGYVYARTQVPTFRSSVRLVLSGHVDYSQVLAVEKVLRLVAAHARTAPVAEAVEAQLATGMDANALLAEIRTQVFADSLTLQIDVDDADPARSERIASAVAAVVQERQEEEMADVPPADRIHVAVLDRPTAALFVWPQTRSIVAGTALLGALAGALLVFVLDFLDDTIQSIADAERWLGLPILGVIPKERR